MRLDGGQQLTWIVTDGDKFYKAVKLLIAGFAVTFDPRFVQVQNTLKEPNGTRLIRLVWLVWLYIAHHSISYLIRYIITDRSYQKSDANHILKDCIIAQIRVQ